MTDYKAEYQITFAHTDGRTKVKSDTMNIEAGSPEEAERIIHEQFQNGDDPLTEFHKFDGL